jgi:hypothetical protein
MVFYNPITRKREYCSECINPAHCLESCEMLNLEPESRPWAVPSDKQWADFERKNKRPAVKAKKGCKKK